MLVGQDLQTYALLSSEEFGECQKGSTRIRPTPIPVLRRAVRTCVSLGFFQEPADTTDLCSWKLVESDETNLDLGRGEEYQVV